MSSLLLMMFTIVFLGLASNRMHLLSALLCLEGMMLTIFIGISLWPGQLSSPYVTSLLVLALSSCEAALGLSLMVATARSQGNDNLKTLNLLQC